LLDRESWAGRMEYTAGYEIEPTTDGLMTDGREPARGTAHIFIGRDPEMAELSAGLEDALGGRGRLFLITGEPGIGKTVLAEQLAARALERGAGVLWGRCWEGGGAPAYWPWIQMLRPLIEGAAGGRADGHTDPGDLARLFPEIAEGLPGSATADFQAQPPSARFRLFAAVAALLRRASADRPLVLVLDDLHEADPASLLLLRFVAGDLRGNSVLIVATCRDIEAQQSAAVAEAFGGLIREGPSIHLGGFDPAEASRFMEALTGDAATEADLLRIHAATAGNPLFIREMVRLEASRAASRRRGNPQIPEGVRAVIHQRLGSFDASTIHALSVAAVIGQDFEFPLVAQVAGLDPAHVLQSLAGAERLGVVVHTSDSSTALRFSHGLVREVLYDDLPIAVRRELHGSVGAAIERLYGVDPGPHLGELAYHFAQAATSGYGTRAGVYAQMAGDQAMASYAYEEAAVQYRRAIDALQFATPDEAQRCELFLRLGDAQARAGDYQEAKTSFMRAAEIARRLHLPESFARAALGYGEPQVEAGLVDQKLLALLRESLDELSPEDSPLRARVLARFSLELTFSDEDARRESLSREAIEMARRLDDVTALAIACRARWMAQWGPDGLEERSALSEEILGLARKTGDRELELIGQARRITCFMESGDIRAADAAIVAHARLAEELRMPYHEWVAATLRTGRVLLEGSFDAAEELAERAANLLRGRLGAARARLNQLTPVRWEQGRLDELREAWQGIVEQFPKAGFARGWLSLTDAELGRDGEARRGLHAQVEELPVHPRDGLWLPTMAVACLAAARLDDGDAAAQLYSRILPYSSLTIVIPMPHPVMCFGSAALYLGVLATACSRWEEAGEHFEAAIQANTGMGATAFLARTRYEYARMLLRRGGGTDPRQALALLDEAESTAAALGMLVLGRQCARLRETVAGTAVAAGKTSTAVPGEPAGGTLFHKEGDYWTIAFEGSLIRLRDSKGLRHLARLLAGPGREFHVIDLEAAEVPEELPLRRSGKRSRAGDLEARPDLGDAGEMLDARAKAEYQARLRELQAELDEAEGFNDPVRAARAREEIEFIASELARAVGLGGRDRRAASHAERARLNVTRAIKTALDNIARNHPPLGGHLRSTIRTGRYCSYTPDPRAPITWEF
jgi:tetratricopeptide (TPR) repeat protein